MVKSRSWQKQTAQLLAVLGFAVAFVVAVMLLHDYSRDHWIPSAASVRVTLFTAITFIAVAVQFRRHWRDFRFWLFVTALLAVHLLAYGLILHVFFELPLLVFTATTLIEIPLVCSIVYRVGFPPDIRT